MMATRTPTEAWGYTDFPPNQQQQQQPPTLIPAFTADALPNFDKELPPMPRPSLEEGSQESTIYGDTARRLDEVVGRNPRSWMDMDSGSESDSVGK